MHFVELACQTHANLIETKDPYLSLNDIKSQLNVELHHPRGSDTRIRELSLIISRHLTEDQIVLIAKLRAYKVNNHGQD